ncbi:putative zinc finger, CCHC-type containing protein [Tanacetum coccineum]|uniref:Zinc finger, CCHC-type containing protein n=1 Tax=Tanacetum coccineum TaxID=301880 RepID=A0ABQ4Y9H3_9ASTR
MITNSQEYLSSRVRSLESIINELRFKIQELHQEIIQIIRTSPTTQPSSSISQKEAEMKNLKNQLQDLERQHKQKRITSLIDDPWRLPSTPFVGVSFDPQPLPQSYTHTTSPSLNIWASEQRRLKPSTKKEPTFSQESQSIADVVASTKTPDVLPIQKYYTIDVVIKRFLNRLQGRLRDWYHSLGEYRQLHIQQLISPEAFMSIIYLEFIGSPWEHTAYAREEFLKMKCCSFQKKDLEKHYNRMSQRFYCLNGVDDVNLKQVFLNSFSESFGNEAYQALEARNFTIAQTTLGDLQSLNQVEPIDYSDLESLYSLNDEPSDSVLCTIAYSDFTSDDDSDTDSLESDSDFGVHMINPLSQKKSLFQNLNAPSAFQKAMITIFEPILANTLVYIDDILLFFPDEQSHAELLSKFYSLVTKYEIMLSEKKIEVGVTTIQFLGMEISNEKYQP